MLLASNAFPDHRPRPPVGIVVIVGIAGSGKTTHVRGAFPGHVHVSMDSHWDDTSRPAERRSLIDRSS